MKLFILSLSLLVTLSLQAAEYVSKAILDTRLRHAQHRMPTVPPTRCVMILSLEKPMLSLRILLLVAAATGLTVILHAAPDGAVETDAPFSMIHPVFEDGSALPTSGTFTRSGDGKLIGAYRKTVESETRIEIGVSGDCGSTWAKLGELRTPEPGVRLGRPSILQLRDGRLVVVAFGLVRFTGDPTTSSSDLWAAFSRDGGKQWGRLERIWKGYTGMTQGVVETSKGTLIVPFAEYLGNVGRWGARVAYSRDAGTHWQASDVVRVPDEVDYATRNLRRHAGGAMEPSVVELEDGRLWMVIRTSTGFLWESFSEDGGESWSNPRQTVLGCGGPAYATRISDGRIVLVWNDADWSAVPEYGYPRGWERISISWSDDETATWAPPRVFARGRPNLYHSFLVEPKPGSLLLTILNGNAFVRADSSQLFRKGAGAPDEAISKADDRSPTNWNPQFDPRVGQDAFMRTGESFAHLPGGGIVRFSANTTSTSHDQGASWSSPLPVPVGDHKPSAAKIAATPSGTLVLAYMNGAENVWNWNSKTKEVSADSTLPVYAMRSTDGGRTWSQPQKIFSGRSGALTDILADKSGSVILPITGFARTPSRCVQFVMVTRDEGLTWTERIIDLGGHGHHEGAMEPTMVELRDGRVWMLIRTNHDVLYEAFSHDGGLSWSKPSPTAISASSSPPMIRRLDSGRLVLVWNRVRPEGMNEEEWAKRPLSRRGGDFGSIAASWHREEVSMAFSEDDGKSWSVPTIIARQPNGWLSYPRLFEPAPGDLKLGLFFNYEIVPGPKAEPRGALFLSLKETSFFSRPAP
jgi:sialidase-1